MKTTAQIFVSNILTFFNMLCFTVAAFLVYVGIAIDPHAFLNMVFLVVIILNIAIGIIQELKAKRIIEKLSLLNASPVTIIRDDNEIQINKTQVALDDIVILATGDQIPTDCRVTEGNILVNESMLTGESDNIQKKIGDELLGGSFIAGGRCRAVVVRVGEDNYINKLQSSVKKYKQPRSELLKSLHIIIRFIGVFIFLITIALLIRQAHSGITTQAQRSLAVMHTAGAIIGMIPSGMFLLTSLALASAVLNLARHKTLVRDLYSVEMLARVDTLCIDKTGTLTSGNMRVRELRPIGGKFIESEIKKIVSSILHATGDSNQTAAALAEYFGVREYYKAKNFIPFSSDKKYSEAHFDIGTFRLGAPEIITGSSPKDTVVGRGGVETDYARVLALSNNSKIIAEILIEDILRTDIKTTLEWFYDNNVDVRVISGDNPQTAANIARAAGIRGTEAVINLVDMSDNELTTAAPDTIVFGRAKPEQKLVIIKKLQQDGRMVAMIGDGVNDILALREADCSIAMGAGSDAARGLSHLVLLDNNFAALPKVVSEGRRVVNNIQKSSSLFLFKALLSMLLAVVALIFWQGRYIFMPRNLYILEFLVIGIPAFALALEKNNNRIKGNFIRNILWFALLGACVAVSNIGILALFRNIEWFSMSYDIFLTLAILSTTAVGFIMLVQICMPLNLYRGTILAALSVAIITVGIQLHDLIGLNRIGVENASLLIIIIFASMMLIFWLAKRIHRHGLFREPG